MSLVALQPGCQTCKAFGFGVGTAVEAEAVVLVVVLVAVVVVVLAAAEAVLAAADVVAALVVAALVLTADVVAADVAADVVVAAEAVVVGVVVTAADAVVGAADDWDDVDTVADAPQAARPTAARTCTLAVSAARRETYRRDHREERMLALHSSGYDDRTGADDVPNHHSKDSVLPAALYPVCCDLSTDRQAARRRPAPGS